MKTYKAKGRNGRPRSLPEDVRQKTIGVRLNSKEWNEIQRKADSQGVPPTVWMRLAALSRMCPRPPVPAVNRQAYADLARLAANLNQLARAAHEGRILIAADMLAAVREQVRLLRLDLLGAGHDRQAD